MSNLWICGFMGCGKTTTGKMLAQRVGVRFIDMDDYIVERAGMPVAKIFEVKGQDYFRELEYKTVCELSAESGYIIATGGGVMTVERNVSAVPAHDSILLLDADFDVCYDRIKDSDRPLVRQNTKEQLKEIFEKRLPFYRRAATHTVSSSDDIEHVVERAASVFQRVV